MKIKTSLLTIGLAIVIFITLSFKGYSQDSRDEKIKSIISHIGAGVEYVKNSEPGIFAQYNIENFAGACFVRRCSHDDKFYVTPILKYYLKEQQIFGITPVVTIRYGKLHYNVEWSGFTYDYDVVYVWDAAMGQMMPEVRTSYVGTSGSKFINSPAVSATVGGEYKIPGIENIAVSATVGTSYFTEIEGDFKNKNKFFFTIGALYYFGAIK